MSTGDTVFAGQFSPYGSIGTRWASRLLPRPRPFEKTAWPDGSPIDPYWPVPEAPAGSDRALNYPFDPFKAISVYLQGNCLTCGPRKCGGATHDSDMTACAQIGGNVLSALWDKYHRAANVVLGLMFATCQEEWYRAHPTQRPKPAAVGPIISGALTTKITPVPTAPKTQTLIVSAATRTSAIQPVARSAPAPTVSALPRAKGNSIAPSAPATGAKRDYGRYALIGAIVLGIGVGGWLLFKRA